MFLILGNGEIIRWTECPKETLSKCSSGTEAAPSAGPVSHAASHHWGSGHRSHVSLCGDSLASARGLLLFSKRDLKNLNLNEVVGRWSKRRPQRSWDFRIFFSAVSLSFVIGHYLFNSWKNVKELYLFLSMHLGCSYCYDKKKYENKWNTKHPQLQQVPVPGRSFSSSTPSTSTFLLHYFQANPRHCFTCKYFITYL